MLAATVIIALHIWILYYIIQLQKSNCECALGMKHKIIRAYLSVMIPLNLLMLTFQIMRSSTLASWIKGHPTTTTSIYTLILLIKAIYIAIVFMYIRELKETKCDCSVHNARTALEMLNYLAIIVVSILIIGGVLMGPSAFSRITVKELYLRFK